MKPTPPVLIFEIIPMDLGDLGGRAAVFYISREKVLYTTF